jgi:hypothetical protein
MQTVGSTNEFEIYACGCLDQMFAPFAHIREKTMGIT